MGKLGKTFAQIPFAVKAVLFLWAVFVLCFVFGACIFFFLDDSLRSLRGIG